MEEKLTKDEYDKYAALCECGMRIVLARIENLRQEAEIATTSRNLYAGIQHRIKTYESGDRRQRSLPLVATYTPASSTASRPTSLS